MTLYLNWVTSIPTPYRNYRYSRMAEAFPHFGIDFEVLYMAWSEPDRHWRFASSDFQYKYRVFSSIHPNVRGVNFHFKPGLLAHLRFRSADVVIVGGYASPTHALSAVAIPPKAFRVLASESNLQSTSWNRGLGVWLKRAMIMRYDAYVVPGAKALQLLKAIDPLVETKPQLTLPNIVDESVFSLEFVVRVAIGRQCVRPWAWLTMTNFDPLVKTSSPSKTAGEGGGSTNLVNRTQ